MDILYLVLIFAILIGILSIVFKIFFAIWPFLLILVAGTYVYNRFFKKPKETYFEEKIEETYYNPFENYTSSAQKNADVIDVEYTEREDED